MPEKLSQWIIDANLSQKHQAVLDHAKFMRTLYSLVEVGRSTEEILATLSGATPTLVRIARKDVEKVKYNKEHPSQPQGPPIFIDDDYDDAG